MIEGVAHGSGTLRRQRGAALVIVIWATAIIGAVVAAYLSRSLLESVYARDRRNEAGARAQAGAGMACFLQRFLADEDAFDAADADWLLAGGGGESVPAFPGGTFQVKVHDLGSRINLNLADEASLLALFEGDRTATSSILDWRDPDSEPRPEGAEDEYYGGLQPPAAPANGLFQCPEEVRLVKGLGEFASTVDEETTIFGAANPNLIGSDVWAEILRTAGFDDWRIELFTEQFTAYKAEALKAGRVPFGRLEDLEQLPSLTSLTLQQLEPYLVFEGRINPNLASEPVLRVALAWIKLNPDSARAICEARENTPFKDLAALAGLLAKNAPQGINRDWLAQVFTVQTTLAGVDIAGSTSSGGIHRITAVIERFHHNGARWRCRILYWREQSGRR